MYGFGSGQPGSGPPYGQRPTIFFYEDGQPYYQFTNFSIHAVFFEGKIYPTSEHLFQALKFYGREFEMERVRRAPGPRAAFNEAHRLKGKERPDWRSVNVEMMRKVLSLKVDQHPDVLEDLLATGNALLVENSKDDAFWGNGFNKQGKNMLGKLWMEIRDERRKSSKLAGSFGAGKGLGSP